MPQPPPQPKPKTGLATQVSATLAVIVALAAGVSFIVDRVNDLARLEERIAAVEREQNAHHERIVEFYQTILAKCVNCPGADP